MNRTKVLVACVLLLGSVVMPLCAENIFGLVFTIVPTARGYARSTIRRLAKENVGVANSIDKLEG